MGESTGRLLSRMGEGESESCWETVDLLSRLSSFLSILKLCTAVLILMANIILIVVILRCPRLRRQRFHMFIISLALADILVGLIMPLMTLALKEQMWPFGSTLCQVFTSVQKISLAASFFNFLGISVDRLFAVKKPFAYRKWQQKHSIIRRPLLLCWLLALLPAIPMWIDPTRSYTDVEDNRNCVCKFPYRYNVWIWWNSVVAFILPTILILVGGFLTALHFARASSVHNDNNSVWKRRF